MLTGYGAPPPNMSAYDPALSAGVSSPGSAHQQYDYTNAIDPALADVAAAPPVNTTAPPYQTTSPGMPTFLADLERELLVVLAHSLQAHWTRTYAPQR